MKIAGARPSLGAIMIQGTCSNAGKSLIAAGLCRIFHQDGYSTAPFKSQNMALNSYITASGGEMGRAQAVQAEAAAIEPQVAMNPVLLKPTSDRGSQVIVNGQVRATMTAAQYFAYKAQLEPEILAAYESLCQGRDIVVIEGAGSPAEINLKSGDMVNMGVAEMAQSPVLLVADIDRGGVFASIYGTVMLLEPQERAKIKGVIINKFRGDPEILKPGLAMIEEKTGVPVLGVVPYTALHIDDEDSLSERLQSPKAAALVDIAVIRLPRMSNFTDLTVFDTFPGLSVRYVGSLRDLGEPDMIVLPGSKNTIADLLWMRQKGLEAAVIKRARGGTVVFGLCGGYQMLGSELSDPLGVESGGTVAAMGLLKARSVFADRKRTVQVEGRFGSVGGVLAGLSGKAFSGYEIHCGVTESQEKPLGRLTVSGGEPSDLDEGSQSQSLNVYGSYVHGLFDEPTIAQEIVNGLLHRKGLDPLEAGALDYRAYRESQYDLLAQTLRDHVDLDRVYRILREGL